MQGGLLQHLQSRRHRRHLLHADRQCAEVAILGISRARMEPVYQKESGQFTARLMLPLSLSYDTASIDGADAIRFLRWVRGGARATVPSRAFRADP